MYFFILREESSNLFGGEGGGGGSHDKSLSILRELINVLSISYKVIRKQTIMHIEIKSPACNLKYN